MTRTTLVLLIVLCFARSACCQNLDLMDNGVDPGADFYRYSCGLWLDDNPLPGGWWRLNTSVVMQDDINRDIATALAAVDGTTSGIAAQLGVLFASGIDCDANRFVNMKTLRSELDRIVALTDLDDLPATLARSHLHGFDPLFSIYDPGRWELRDVHELHLRQGGLGLDSRGYYLNDNERAREVRRRYLAHVTRMFELSGDPNPAVTAQVVMDLETKLAAVQEPAAANLRDYHNFKSLTKLRKMVSALDWDDWFDGLGIEPPSTVALGQPRYFKALGGIVKETDVATWRAYLSWQLLNHMGKCLPADMRAERDGFFYDFLHGYEMIYPWRERVVSGLMTALPEMMDAYYTQRFFPPETERIAQAMVTSIKEATRKRLEHCTWMTEMERGQALTKLAEMEFRIGGGDEGIDFTPLQFKMDDYLANILKARRFHMGLVLTRLGEPWAEDRWGHASYGQDMAFDHNQNIMNAVASNFRPPKFDPQGDVVANYAGVGWGLAHEITHSFDSLGRLFGADGNSLGWLARRKLSKGFKDRCRPLIEQYDDYEALPGCHVSGEGTLMENLADLGGVLIVYDALESVIGKEGLSAIRDGFTAEQRFFIAYAQSWSENISDSAQEAQARGPHSPTRFRAIGPLRNIDAFHSAFDIKPGDAMYLPPESRARIW
ncbi:MAG: M13 family metallopeptidase [bacterium]|nr:M13 family metallopeptidase [bacterium]